MHKQFSKEENPDGTKPTRLGGDWERLNKVYVNLNQKRAPLAGAAYHAWFTPFLSV